MILQSVLINWGDGDFTASAGRRFAGQAGSFTVSGLYAYQTPGTYTASVTLTSATTAQTASAAATVNVVNTTNSPFFNPYAFTIALAPVPSNGPNAANGLTITNRPTLTGTAPPFALVQLTANRIDVDATLDLGEAVANGSGQWTLGTNPLADGIYDIVATVTPPGSLPPQQDDQPARARLALSTSSSSTPHRHASSRSRSSGNPARCSCHSARASAGLISPPCLIPPTTPSPAPEKRSFTRPLFR